MRLYSSQFNIIAGEIIRTLQKDELMDIEPEQLPEAELDVVGVLREYNRMAREITRQARDMTVGDGATAERRMKQRLARDKNFKFGDDAIDYVVSQIIETFLQSINIAEIYGTDRELRARIATVLKKYGRDRSEEIDREVRSKLKNLEEGSAAWDIEYEKALARVKDRKGMSPED